MPTPIEHGDVHAPEPLGLEHRPSDARDCIVAPVGSVREG